MTETELSDAVARYVRFWNTSPDEQRRSGGKIFTEEVAYIAPAGVLSGVDALAGFAEQFIDNVGEYLFRTRAEPDIHHDRARVAWEIQVGDASFAEGTDMLTVNDDGTIASITTFIDRSPVALPHHAQPDSK